MQHAAMTVSAADLERHTAMTVSAAHLQRHTAMTFAVHVCKGAGQEQPKGKQNQLPAAAAGVTLTLACSQQVHPQPELQGQGVAEHRVASRNCCNAQLLLQRITVPEQRGGQGPACLPGTGSWGLGLCTGQACP